MICFKFLVYKGEFEIEMFMEVIEMNYMCMC